MKAIQVEYPTKLAILDLPMPSINREEEVMIKVEAAGICGSDMHIYHGTSPMVVYPRIIGHEIAGNVVETGGAVSKFKPGDHVVMDPVVNCGGCYPCSIKRFNVCSNLKVRGVHLDGGFQEYMVLPQSCLYKVSSTVSWEKTVMVEPFSIAAQVVSRGEITSGDTVFIMGAGPIGLIILMIVKKIGAKCLISDLIDQRLALARTLGADVTINASNTDVKSCIQKETDHAGPSVIIDAACLQKSFEEAVQLASPAARVITLGFNDQPSQITQLAVTAKELDIKGSRLNCRRFPQVIKWFEKDGVDPTVLVTHSYHFTEIKKAIAQIEKNPVETVKVILKFN